MEKIFTKEHYNSPDGMLTSVWGPPLWHTLHTISFNYPVKPDSNDIKNYYTFFKSLENILPCKYCRDNLKNNLKVVKLNKSVFKNRYTLAKWVYNLHEEVNKMLGKKSNLTFEQIQDRYENFRARCLKSKNKESGCNKSLYGVKGKCILNIVPKDNRSPSLKIDPKCKVKKIK